MCGCWHTMKVSIPTWWCVCVLQGSCYQDACITYQRCLRGLPSSLCHLITISLLLYTSLYIPPWKQSLRIQCSHGYISHQTLAACSSCQLHFPNRTNPKTANKRYFWVWKVKPAWKCPKLTLFVMISRGRLLRFEKDVCVYEIDGKKNPYFHLISPQWGVYARIC